MQTYYWQLRNNQDNSAIIRQAAYFIRKGEVVAFPTETVYGLGADGLNSAAVVKIFAAKGRPNDNPLILHIADAADLQRLTVDYNANARVLAERFWPGPLTLVVRKKKIVPDTVSAGLATVAVRCPSNEFARQLIRASACPIAAPSANISGRPSPTNARDVLEDMQGKIACVLDGGSCEIGLESTVVDTTEPVPVILRPGGISYEMITDVLGAVEIDPAVGDAEKFRPKAPGMKYRHYAPKASMYLLEGEACSLLPRFVRRALALGMRVGVLCSADTAKQLLPHANLILSQWRDETQLAADLFLFLRDFDRSAPDLIISEGVAEDGIGLAVMNRMRKAAGYQLVTSIQGKIYLKNDINLPEFML